VLTDAWATCYPAIMRLWDNAWAEFAPVLASVNARIRRAVRAPFLGG
jgi:putative transposase